ncbi:29543_t:CDS:2, partial [Gigaspora margarita]
IKLSKGTGNFGTEIYEKNFYDSDMNLYKSKELHISIENLVYKESVAKNKFSRILAIVDTDGKLKITVQCILIFEELPNNSQ